MPTTDEDAASQAISSIASPSKDQEAAREKISRILLSDDPFIDIQDLFRLFDLLYFRSLLSTRVEVSWSPRLTLCAGICELGRDPSNGNKYTKVRLKLSEPLLKYRPRSDVVDTLLHECIHAYFFITTSWQHSRGDDGTGHGAGFLLLANAINTRGDYHISVYHTFHDEVDFYRTHVWQCDGPCQSQPPFFGLVKRSMNRPPGKSDTWWSKHIAECGGAFTKISEPDLTKDQVEKLGGLKRAGLQKNKIDTWVMGKDETGKNSTINNKRSRNVAVNVAVEKKQKLTVTCPICEDEVEDSAINDHLDSIHPG